MDQPVKWERTLEETRKRQRRERCLSGLLNDKCCDITVEQEFLRKRTVRHPNSRLRNFWKAEEQFTEDLHHKIIQVWRIKPGPVMGNCSLRLSKVYFPLSKRLFLGVEMICSAWASPVSQGGD